MRFVVAIALVLAVVAPAAAREDTTLRARLARLAAAHHGRVAVFATDLRSGKTVSLHGDTVVPTASVIKLAILFEALKQLQTKHIHLHDTIMLTSANQVPGSGVFLFFDTPQRLTLNDALTMMIVVSDNTATNMLIDRLGLRNIDDRIRWLRLRHTWLYKKVILPTNVRQPADYRRFGLGKTTPREMADLMRRFAACDLNPPGSAVPPTRRDRALCHVAMHMLRSQFDQDGLPRYLRNVKVANKTGALNAVRNDVAIVYARNGPIVISAFTYDNADHSWTADNAAQLLLAKIGKAILDRWN